MWMRFVHRLAKLQFRRGDSGITPTTGSLPRACGQQVILAMTKLSGGALRAGETMSPLAQK